MTYDVTNMEEFELVRMADFMCSQLHLSFLFIVKHNEQVENISLLLHVMSSFLAVYYFIVCVSSIVLKEIR